MGENITEIKPTEITKPKKLAKKAIGLLEAGLGGVLQESIGTVLSGFIPSQIPSELAKAGEAIGLMTIGGSTSNKHVKQILAGAIAGSAKDLTKMVMNRLNINLSQLGSGLPTLGIPKFAGSQGAEVMNISGATEADMEDY